MNHSIGEVLAFQIESILREAVRAGALPIGLDCTGLATGIQALADVRTLDEWALAKPGREVIIDRTGFGGLVDCYVGLDNEIGERENFDGATPDAARAKAAGWVREQSK